MRAYKSAKDGNKKTGSAPIQVPFQEILDEIFGSQPNISNEIVLNLRGKATQSLQLRNTPPSYRAEFSVSPPPLDLPPSPTLESSPSSSPSQSPIQSPSNIALTSESPTPDQRNKKITKKNYYAEKLSYLKTKEESRKELLQQLRKDKENRFNKLLEMKSKQNEERMTLLKQLLKEKGLFYKSNLIFINL